MNQQALNATIRRLFATETKDPAMIASMILDDLSIEDALLLMRTCLPIYVGWLTGNVEAGALVDLDGEDNTDETPVIWRRSAGQAHHKKPKGASKYERHADETDWMALPIEGAHGPVPLRDATIEDILTCHVRYLAQAEAWTVMADRYAQVAAAMKSAGVGRAGELPRALLAKILGVKESERRKAA